jgi:hypothetical protein
MFRGILINIIDQIEAHKVAYLKYRGSSFDKDGTLYWAKDDAMAYAEGLDAAIQIIKGETIEIM